MHDAGINIVEDLCGCGGHVQEIDEESLLLPVPYEMLPLVSYTKPWVEAVKTRDEQREVQLDFPVGKINILPDYMDNRAELDEVETFLGEIRADKNIEVTRIDITGYASPEGSLKNNEWLASERAKALKNYLVTRVSFPANVYHVQNGEENWEGLLKLLELSDIKDKGEVIAIIKGTEDANVRKSKLKSLDGGKVYRQMLSSLYPRLRKVECSVAYNVRSLTVEEGKQMLETNPRYLSLDEMYHIANSYPQGSPEFRNVFEIAVRTYPNDPVANLNAAAIALSRGDLPQAKSYLDKSDKNTPEYMNNLGVYYMFTGELDQAKAELTRALQKGVENAGVNLKEIEKKLENDR